MPKLHAYILVLRTPYCRKMVRVWRWIQFRIFGFLSCSQQTTNPTEVNAVPSSRDPEQLQASLTWRPECVVPGKTLVGRRQPTRTKHSRPVAQLPWMSPGRPRWNRDTRALFNALLRTIGRVASQKSRDQDEGRKTARQTSEQIRQLVTSETLPQNTSHSARGNCRSHRAAE